MNSIRFSHFCLLRKGTNIASTEHLCVWVCGCVRMCVCVCVWGGYLVVLFCTQVSFVSLKGTLKISLAFWSPNSNSHSDLRPDALQKPELKLILLWGLRRKENFSQGDDEEFTQVNASEEMWVLAWIGTILTRHITYPLRFDFSKKIEKAVHPTSFWKKKKRARKNTIIAAFLLSDFSFLLISHSLIKDQWEYFIHLFSIYLLIHLFNIYPLTQQFPLMSG